MTADLQELFDRAGRNAPEPALDPDLVLLRARRSRSRRRALTSVGALAAVGLLALGAIAWAGANTTSRTLPSNKTPSPPPAADATKSGSVIINAGDYYTFTYDDGLQVQASPTEGATRLGQSARGSVYTFTMHLENGPAVQLWRTGQRQGLAQDIDHVTVTAEASARLAVDPSRWVLGTLEDGCPPDLRLAGLPVRCDMHFTWSTGQVLSPVRVRIVRTGAARLTKICGEPSVSDCRSPNTPAPTTDTTQAGWTEWARVGKTDHTVEYDDGLVMHFGSRGETRFAQRAKGAPSLSRCASGTYSPSIPWVAFPTMSR